MGQHPQQMNRYVAALPSCTLPCPALALLNTSLRCPEGAWQVRFCFKQGLVNSLCLRLFPFHVSIDLLLLLFLHQGFCHGQMLLELCIHSEQTRLVLFWFWCEVLWSFWLFFVSSPSLPLIFLVTPMSTFHLQHNSAPSSLLPGPDRSHTFLRSCILNPAIPHRTL